MLARDTEMCQAYLFISLLNILTLKKKHRKEMLAYSQTNFLQLICSFNAFIVNHKVAFLK